MHGGPEPRGIIHQKLGEPTVAGAVVEDSDHRKYFYMGPAHEGKFTDLETLEEGYRTSE